MKGLLFKIVIAVVAVSMAASSFAQGAGPRSGQGGPPNAGQRAEMTKKIEAAKKKVYAELKLTPDQIKKIAALDKKMADKMGAMRKKYQGQQGKPLSKAESDKVRAEFQAMRATQEKELKAILGNKFPQYQKRMQEETMKFRRRGNGAPGAAGKGSAGAGKASGGKKP